jgi:hypothetical protein
MLFATTYSNESSLTERVNEPFSSYPFSNQGDERSEMLVISHLDANYCTQCHYLVVVLAISELDYTVVMSE